MINTILPTITIGGAIAIQSQAVLAEETKRPLEYMPALQGLDYGKPRTLYPDFTHSPTGLQYKIVKQGNGSSPKKGDRVVVDWEGYTIGYYGRPFQTRNKVKGGAFESSETDYFRWIVGSGSAIAALDEAVQQVQEVCQRSFFFFFPDNLSLATDIDTYPGGIVQVVVPAELGYPARGDPEHDLVGPKPSTFSGMRALNFVLDNQNLIDKTLLINIRLVKVDSDYDKRKPRDNSR
eukprot:scaffold504_cov189-Ochromonas_danica.AAC.55